MAASFSAHAGRSYAASCVPLIFRSRWPAWPDSANTSPTIFDAVHARPAKSARTPTDRERSAFFDGDALDDRLRRLEDIQGRIARLELCQQVQTLDHPAKQSIAARES